MVRGMKKILAVLCGALALAGCGGEEDSKSHDPHSGEPNLDDPETRKQIIAEAIDETKLSTEKEGDEKTWHYDGLPFNGWVKDINSRTNKVEMLVFLKDGKPDGLEISFHDSGRKKKTRWWKNGKKHGLEIYYNDDGTEARRTTYKDGEVVE
jgi:antitoxin component YwqK of YwqJK toxin-antitoxin module